MTSKWSNHEKHLAGATAGLNLQGHATAGTLGVLLVMTGWSYAANKDDLTLADLGLAGLEYDGANYGRRMLGNATWTKDATNNQSELSADPSVWANLGPGTDPAIGYILFREDGASDAQRIFLGFSDAGGFPKDGQDADFTIEWDVAGGVMSIGDEP